MSEKLETQLLNAAANNEIALSHQQAENLICYLELIQKWNRTHNLTAITSPLEMVNRHLIDSLSISSYIPIGRILDVGSGAGLPGIPLAIMYPDRNFELVDASHKKVAFLREVCRALSLKNTIAHHARVESLPPDGFNAITCRAFSSLRDFVDKTQHLLTSDGVWLAMKGVYPAQEIAELEVDQYSAKAHVLKIDSLRVERHLVQIELAG